MFYFSTLLPDFSLHYFPWLMAYAPVHAHGRRSVDSLLHGCSPLTLSAHQPPQSKEAQRLMHTSPSAVEANDLNPLFLPLEISTCSKPFRYF